MTTMNEAELISLGFNKNEAIVYLALIETGSTDAHTLIQKTKFHKNIVYDNLNKLIDKGLVSFIQQDSKRVFSVTPGEMLVEHFREKETEIQNNIKKAKNISDEISKTIASLPPKQNATIYRGIKGVKEFFALTLQGGDYLTLGAPQESVDMLGVTFWHNLNAKAVENKQTAKLLFNESLRDYGKTVKNKYTFIKYLEQEFEALTETVIQGDMVAIVVWSQEPIVFMIQDKYVASSYEKYFEKLWSQAKD